MRDEAFTIRRHRRIRSLPHLPRRPAPGSPPAAWRGPTPSAWRRTENSHVIEPSRPWTTPHDGRDARPGRGGLRLALCLGSGGPANGAATPDPAGEGAEFFEKEIRPILVENCLGCHSARRGRSGGGTSRSTARPAGSRGGPRARDRPRRPGGKPADRGDPLSGPGLRDAPEGEAVRPGNRRADALGEGGGVRPPGRRGRSRPRRRSTSRRGRICGRSGRPTTRPSPRSPTRRGPPRTSTASSWPGSRRRGCDRPPRRTGGP